MLKKGLISQVYSMYFIKVHCGLTPVYLEVIQIFSLSYESDFLVRFFTLVPTKQLLLNFEIKHYVPNCTGLIQKCLT